MEAHSTDCFSSDLVFSSAYWIICFSVAEMCSILLRFHSYLDFKDTSPISVFLICYMETGKISSILAFSKISFQCKGGGPVSSQIYPSRETEAQTIASTGLFSHWQERVTLAHPVWLVTFSIFFPWVRCTELM